MVRKKVGLSIIILSYNTKELLEQCINSIYDTTKQLDYEIIVVDNASRDGSTEMIATKFSNVILIRNDKNVGFAKANNQAIRIARGRYILLLNSDAIIVNNGIGALIDFMDNHPKAAAAGPKVLNKDGTLQSKGYTFPSITLSLIKIFGLNKLLPTNMKYAILPKFYWHENYSAKVDWLSGCCLLIRKDAINNIGRLSEDYFLYYEETEWCYRAKKIKYEIWYVPRAVVFHLNRSSPNKLYLKHLRASKVIFYKQMGKTKGITISLLTLISFLLMYIYVTLIKDKEMTTKLREDISSEISFLRDLRIKS